MAQAKSKLPQIVQAKRVKKLFYLRPDLVRAFNILAAEQGSRSGPKLIEEALNLLLVRYGKKPL